MFAVQKLSSKATPFIQLQGNWIMAQTRQRPLSPHLFDGWKLHWRWGPHMIVSIFHRVTGAGLGVAGPLVLLWWLYALMSGPQAYSWFNWAAASWIGQIVLIAMTWAYFQHLATGLRHFVLDMGAGYELKANRFWANMTMVLAVALTAIVWGLVYFGGML
jgi:succinate dehydrogenase / fumarate reductase, cytochrome b subunit